MTAVYLGLVHGPVRNKKGEEVVTSVTNLDIHDIARTCRTFGIARYFIITPILAQQALLQRILGYWEQDEANLYNPDRQDALSCIKVVNSIEECEKEIEQEHQIHPFVAVTGANFKDYDGDERELVAKINLDRKPLLLLFGTGWGLLASTVEKADFRLGPILGLASDGYNHLSVRSAVAIYCDRLARSLCSPE